MSEATVLIGVLSLAALVGAWMAHRRFLRAVREEINGLANLIGRWAEAEQRRQQQMREGAATIEGVVRQLREAVTRVDQLAGDLRLDAAKLEGPLGRLVEDQRALGGALGMIERQVREVTSTLTEAAQSVPESGPEPAGSIEALVLDMIRHPTRSRSAPSASAERGQP